jgi:hypothetical protein
MSHASARQRSHARWYVLELNHLLNSLGFVSGLFVIRRHRLRLTADHSNPFGVGGACDVTNHAGDVACPKDC